MRVPGRAGSRASVGSNMRRSMPFRLRLLLMSASWKWALRPAASGQIPIPYDAPDVAPPSPIGFANPENDKGKLREPQEMAVRGSVQRLSRKA
jgi:hypothetical protein